MNNSLYEITREYLEAFDRLEVDEETGENVNEERKRVTAQNGAGGRDGFDRFWSAYPRKVGKKDAVKVWNQIKPDDSLIDQIVQGVERWKRSEQWTKDEGRFIPYPATFLRGERWNEYDRAEVTPSPKPTAAKNYDDGEDFLGE